MAKVHVICGGISGEREVSLRSGAALAAALKKAGHSVAIFDTTDPLIMIAACDVVFPALHGLGGEDGTLQAQLEANVITFIGSGSKASQLCFDKHVYRDFLLKHKLPIASGDTVHKAAYTKHRLAKKPHVLKPIDGGSSLDTHIIRDVSQRDHKAISKSFDDHSTLLLEQLIVGTEITVGVLGNRALPVIEIIPPSNGEFDFVNKYNGKTKELCPPKHVSKSDQEIAQQLALTIHRLTGCRDFSRTDMILGRNGSITVLETNTIPGLTEQSLYPKMVAEHGLDMVQLVDQLVHTAIGRT